MDSIAVSLPDSYTHSDNDDTGSEEATQQTTVSATPPASGAAAARCTRKTRPRWSKAQIRLVLELLGTARNEGRFRIDNPTLTKAVHRDINAALASKHPESTWNMPKVSRKIGELEKLYSTWLTIREMSGTTYNEETGAIHCSDVQWASLERSHPNARKLRKEGLPHLRLYEAAFVEGEPMASTAIEAGDLQGLNGLRSHPVSSQDQDDDEEMEDEEDEEGEDDIPASFPSTPPVPLPRARQSSSSSSSAGRPHRATQRTSQTAIDQSLIQLIQRQGHGNERRHYGASDLEAAIKDIIERFTGKAEADEIENFLDFIQQDPVLPVRYNSMTPMFKERMFRRPRDGVIRGGSVGNRL